MTIDNRLEMKKEIYYLSASDRLNYGDLLFPIIFNKVMSSIDSSIIFNNYSTIDSNLTHFDALKTKSYRKFYKDINKTGGNIIIGGGEVLFSSWSILYGFINPFFSKISNSYKFKAFENKFNFTKYLLSNGAINYPFIPSTKNFSSKVKIQYISVGGGFFGVKSDKNIESLKDSLLTSSYISVRDIRTQNSLVEKGIPSQLFPDSALIMSDFFPNDLLVEKTSLEVDLLPKRYLFLQIGNNKGPKNISEFSSKILEQAKSLNMDVILCPIGQSPNHEDQIILNKIK